MISFSIRYALCSLGLCCLLASAGCEPPKPIRSYKVPKPEVVYESNHLDPGLPTDKNGDPLPLDDRMLGALIPNKDTAWFLKLSGPKSEVDSHADEFREFVNSIRFGKDSRREPEWDLPESWTRTNGPPPRWATITIGGTNPPLEVTVSSLPFENRDLASYSLQNVNRWRNQLSLRPIPAQRLSKEVETITLAGGSPAVYVDMLGKLQGTGMMRPGAMAGHPPISGGDTRPAPKTSSQTPADRQPAEVGYDLPTGWSKAANDTFSQVALEAGEGANGIRVTFSALAAAAGDLGPNINRWRRQVGLGPVSDEDIQAAAKEMEIGGVKAPYVELQGPQESIYGAIVMHEDKAWFIKLRGSNSAAEAEQTKFQELLKSIRFE